MDKPSILPTIKRGDLEAFIINTPQGMLLAIFRGKTFLKKSAKTYDDQDEAEVELGVLIDEVWREKPTENKLVRRL